MDSKYYGRAIKKWRVTAELSQEELAALSDLSPQVLGVIEREKGRFSTASLAKLCIGLESKLGIPMLARIFRDGTTALWQELLSIERDLRKEKGWTPVEYGASGVSPEELDESYDSASAEIRSYIKLLHRSLGSQKTEWEPLPEPYGDAPEGESGGTAGKVRVKKSRKKS